MMSEQNEQVAVVSQERRPVKVVFFGLGAVGSALLICLS